MWTALLILMETIWFVLVVALTVLTQAYTHTRATVRTVPCI